MASNKCTLCVFDVNYKTRGIPSLNIAILLYDWKAHDLVTL